MTGKQQALEILRDGEPHSHRELYRELRANPNVVSKLRKEGWLISCTRRDGGYWYRLEAEPRPVPAPLLNGEVPEISTDQLALHV
jgi:hypothetical protein